MTDLIPFPPAAAVAAAAVLGLAIGSFLNVVIHRLPRMLEADWRTQCAELAGEAPAASPKYNLMVPRSACPSCGHALRARDNIPILSYLLLRGRCAFCGARISPRYPLVEALTAALSAAAIAHFGATAAGGLALVLTWTLVALAFIDADTTLLPDDLTLPLLWLGLAANLDSTFVPLREAVIGAIVGYLALWAIYWAFRLATGKEGMGYGDFKLLAALGAWLGVKMLLPIVLLSSVVGAAAGLALIALARRGREVPMPFGPYLAAAGYLVLLSGPSLAKLVGIG
ncbi:MAG TPA: A24 family peptidase [Burkholderiaceae bacterium]|nr:A24 family peptidase [Burkholderiaceae bacterium]